MNLLPPKNICKSEAIPSPAAFLPCGALFAGQQNIFLLSAFFISLCPRCSCYLEMNPAPPLRVCARASRAASTIFLPLDILNLLSPTLSSAQCQRQAEAVLTF